LEANKADKNRDLWENFAYALAGESIPRESRAVR
jgi:hypothetical protein